MMASLDHVIWFPNPFDASAWHIFETDSVYAADGRALCRGRLFTRDGTLVATVVQEGVIRAKL